MDDTRLAEIETYHYAVPVAGMTPLRELCATCWRPWPCDVITLAVALRAERAKNDMLQSERDVLRDRVVQLQPGTVDGIVNAMFDEAQKRGHSPYSSVHALTFLTKTLDRLQAERDALLAVAEAAERLTAQHGTVRMTYEEAYYFCFKGEDFVLWKELSIALAEWRRVRGEQ